ncbi:MAG TPA: uracil-DNA glycosylase [Thermoanaerobaculia bacterium]|nr:uracil-DNA glycosylase [Thermoanaerobaculia bacterium]
MRRPLTPALAELLAYLGEIGYGDIYVRAAAHAAPDLVVPAAPSPVQPVQPVQRASAKTPDAEERAAQLAALAATVAGCTRCRLSEGRNKVVFGSGNPNAELMLIGEGPGAEEDRQGLPFVGPAGELLTKIIQAIDLQRDDIYIANVVKCRPPGNRDPQPDEVAACRGFLEKQIALVQPRVIVALGKVAAQTLLGNESPIGQMRGRWYRIHGVPAMVTYHPAALLRNQALKRPTWEDMQQVRDRLRSG